MRLRRLEMSLDHLNGIAQQPELASRASALLYSTTSLSAQLPGTRIAFQLFNSICRATLTFAGSVGHKCRLRTDLIGYAQRNSFAPRTPLT